MGWKRDGRGSDGRREEMASSHGSRNRQAAREMNEDREIERGRRRPLTEGTGVQLGLRCGVVVVEVSQGRPGGGASSHERAHPSRPGPALVHLTQLTSQVFRGRDHSDSTASNRLAVNLSDQQRPSLVCAT